LTKWLSTMHAAVAKSNALVDNAFLVPGLSDMCSQVCDCCDDGTTTNDGVNTCMTTAFEVTVPNFESIIPGGIPDLEGVGDDSTEAIDSLAATDEDMSMRLTF